MKLIKEDFLLEANLSDVRLLQAKIKKLDDFGYKNGYDKIIKFEGIEDTVENHKKRYTKELEDIYNYDGIEEDLTESIHELNSIKIPGYTNTWSSIDVYDVTVAPFKSKRYFLMENDKYGDETQYLVVSEDLSEIYETYDDIETALRDEGILESLNEDIDSSHKLVAKYYVPHIYKEGSDIDTLSIYQYEDDGDTWYSYKSNSFGSEEGFESENEAYQTFQSNMDKEFMKDWGLAYEVVTSKEYADKLIASWEKEFADDLDESIVKTSKGKWVNKGKEGVHGEFLTKNKAREQQKAMFASGWKGESLEESADRISIESDFEDITNMSDARERLKKYNIDLVKKDNRNYILRKDGKEYTFYVLDNPNEVRKDLVKAVYKLTSGNSAIKENIGSDIAEYQKWVDYDMKKYGRVSDDTNEKIKKAGLKIVKDKYGDYEVIANEPIREDIEMGSTTPDKSKINFNINDNGDFTFTINGKEYKGHTDKPEDMSKDLKDFGFNLTEDLNQETVKEDVSQTNKETNSENGPKTKDTGIAQLLIDAINGEWDTIKLYNDIVVNLEEYGYKDIADVIRDIVVEENVHIGQLQKSLETISPNVSSIEDGSKEAESQLTDKVESDELNQYEESK